MAEETARRRRRAPADTEPKLAASIQGAPEGGWRWAIAGFVVECARGGGIIGIGFHF
jgi:hypothetical protein